MGSITIPIEEYNELITAKVKAECNNEVLRNNLDATVKRMNELYTEEAKLVGECNRKIKFFEGFLNSSNIILDKYTEYCDAIKKSQDQDKEVAG